MSEEPQPAPKPAPQPAPQPASKPVSPEVFHVIWLDNHQSFDEDGEIPLIHYKSVTGRADLEIAIRNILSEYSEHAQIRVFLGEAIQVSDLMRRSILTATITYPKGEPGVVTVG